MSWRHFATLALLATIALGALAPARAEAADVEAAAGWLESVQNADGGFGASPGNDSSVEITCWAMLGLEAAGRNPLDVSRGGSTPVDFLRRNVGALESPGALAHTILALEGAGVDPRALGGQNLVSRLLSRRRDNGSYEGWPNSTAYAVIALRAAGITGVERSLAWLRQVQNEDGGWGDTPGSPSTADGTGAVLQALSSDSKASGRGLSYLRQTQHTGGGFALGGNAGVNTRSTAWAVQGILAAGGDPASFRRGGSSALDYLTANQESNGSFRYAKPGAETPDEVAHQTPIWVTGEVLVAASGDYLPISPSPRKPKSAPDSSDDTFFGGLTPDDIPDANVGSAPLPDFDSAGSGAATPSEPSLTPSAGGGKSGGATDRAGPGDAKPSAGDPKPPPSAPTASTESSSDDSETSAAGAIGAGLAAGALLFGAAWASRRGWMRWRYGL